MMSRFNINLVEEIPFTIEQSIWDLGLYLNEHYFNRYQEDEVLFEESFFRAFRVNSVVSSEVYYVYYDIEDIVRKVVCEKEYDI